MNVKVKLWMSIIFMLISFVIWGGILSFATTEAKVGATVTYQNLNANNEIFVTIDIKEFQDIGDGINAYILTINFDNDKLAFVKAEGLNGWNSPTYNSNNLENGKIKFVATRSNFSKETGGILKITLKTKNNLTPSDINQISFEGVSFANKINNSTQKLQVENISLKLLNLNENNSNLETQDEEKPEEHQEIVNGENKYSDTAKGPLPQAGASSYIIFFVILIINILVFYRYIKK